MIENKHFEQIGAINRIWIDSLAEGAENTLEDAYMPDKKDFEDAIKELDIWLGFR